MVVDLFLLSGLTQLYKKKKETKHTVCSTFLLRRLDREVVSDRDDTLVESLCKLRFLGIAPGTIADDVGVSATSVRVCSCVNWWSWSCCSRIDVS